MTPPQASPAGIFSVKIENTTYVVGVHFSQTAKETLEDKMKRLMLDDVKTANF
ncbi:transposon-encoded TnpW family protein [Faecalibacterium sp. An58]|uniref:transposon-encoded TnpW family protein n=1 Tax=Faecalibacterium sp. An58 TaxID=1965648 RepID=UPI000B386410|nr:transposon-encoded TnpW family protein [Faecalibacterium sp. An58]